MPTKHPFGQFSIKNTSGASRFFGYLPRLGRNLANGQTVVLDNDFINFLSPSKKAALVKDIAAGKVAFGNVAAPARIARAVIAAPTASDGSDQALAIPPVAGRITNVYLQFDQVGIVSGGTSRRWACDVKINGVSVFSTVPDIIAHATPASSYNNNLGGAADFGTDKTATIQGVTKGVFNATIALQEFKPGDAIQTRLTVTDTSAPLFAVTAPANLRIIVEYVPLG